MSTDIEKNLMTFFCWCKERRNKHFVC
jgi:hypothetical protein